MQGEDEARYDYFRLCRVFLETEEHVQVFQELEARSDSYTFYGHARKVGQRLTLMVAANKIAEFKDIVSRFGVQSETLEQNMQSRIDAEKLTISAKVTPPEAFGWDAYFHLETIYSWMELLSKKYDFVSIVELGQSYEGNVIRGVKIERGENKPTVFVEGGIHSREFISPATATFIINELLTSKDAAIMSLTLDFNWIFFPCINPDGYKYCLERDRLWRKSRQPHGLFRGTDLNRNFDIAWNSGEGASADSASYDYAGPNPFSEPEAKLVADFIQQNATRLNIKTYIALHSYSQLIMFPFGHTPDPVANYSDLKLITEAAGKAIESISGKVYASGSKHETIYPSCGGSIDWAFKVANIPISITFELRGPPDSSDMFLLPASEIIPTGREAMAAFVAILKEAGRLGYYDFN